MPMTNRARTARRVRMALAFVVGVCLLLLSPLMYLEPPDPLWIGGIWDDDDVDAVVVLVKNTQVPCDSPQWVFVPLEPCLSSPPTVPIWGPIQFPVRWPENRAPPGI